MMFGIAEPMFVGSDIAKAAASKSAGRRGQKLPLGRAAAAEAGFQDCLP
jgi:hypothetical protein